MEISAHDRRALAVGGGQARLARTMLAGWGMALERFEQLEAWQVAHALALDAFAYGERLMAERHYVIARQLQRAALSVPANIAEGFSRRSLRDKARF